MLLFFLNETYLHSSVDNFFFYKARMKQIFLLLFNSRGSVLYFDVACSDIHTTKYSGGHESLVEIIKNTGGGWQLFSKTLAGKELLMHKRVNFVILFFILGFAYYM